MNILVTVGLDWYSGRVVSLALLRSVGVTAAPVAEVKVYRSVETPLPDDLAALVHLDVLAAGGKTADRWWHASLTDEPSSNRTVQNALESDPTIGFAYAKYRSALRTVDLTYPELITEVCSWARGQKPAAVHHLELLKSLRGVLARAIVKTARLDPTKPPFDVAGCLGMVVQDCLVAFEVP